MLEQVSKDVLADLSEHHRNRDELLKNYIQERLNKSLEVYYNQLIANYNSILNSCIDEVKLARKVAKEL